VWHQLELRSAQLEDGLRSAAEEAGVATVFQRVGTMFTTFFTHHRVTNWSSAKTCDTHKYAAFFRAMLEHGIYLAPSQFEAGFMSLAHAEEEIQRTIEAAQSAFKQVA
jgi:glutamate-1-semialdehyde 2,1-aminomutase